MKLVYPTPDPIITQYFGENPQTYARFGYPGHNGVDLWSAAEEKVILSALDGYVETVAWQAQGYGKYAVVLSGEYACYYCHLAACFVKPGQHLAQQEALGWMGDTGFADGVHLHFGLRLKGGGGAYQGFIDPLPYLQGQPLPLEARIPAGKYVYAASRQPYTRPPTTRGRKTIYYQKKIVF